MPGSISRPLDDALRMEQAFLYRKPLPAGYTRRHENQLLSHLTNFLIFDTHRDVG